MTSRIGQWGGSLSVRLPKNVAIGAGVKRDDEVFVRLLDSGDILVRPVGQRSATELAPGNIGRAPEPKVETKW